MINDFWNLVVETWEQGIRGIGIDNLIICLLILIGSLIARSLMNTYLLDKIASFTEKSETTLDDEIIESLYEPNAIYIFANKSPNAENIYKNLDGLYVFE